MSSQDDYKHENEDFKHVLAVQREFITPLTNHERRCSLEKDFDHLANKSRQICTFIDEEGGNCILGDAKDFRKYLDGMIAQYPELFPVTIRQGYTLHDILPESVKMPGIRLRRIKVKANDGNGDEVFTIRPSFVMPYMVGYTNYVEKPLFLRRWGVSHWALAYVFGHDEQYWYRIYNHIGRNNIVETTREKP